MKLRHTVAGVLVAGLMAVTGGSIWAAQRQAGPRLGMGMRMGSPVGMGLPLARLNLTGAQRQQIRAIVQQHRTDIQPLAQRARAARAGLLTAEAADPLDDNAVRAKAVELAAIQGDLAVARAHLRADVLQVLTPEQQQKVRERGAQVPGRAQQGPGI
jgi:Spy/CpxP family protein refolding chaperone